MSIFLVSEDEWARAFAAAYEQLKYEYSRMLIDCSPSVLRPIAARVASAAIHAATEAPDDISDIPGVHVERITVKRLPAA